jgi:hypothetical protein
MIGKGDITAQVGKTWKAQEEETHLFLGYRVVGTGLGVPPEENPKILAPLHIYFSSLVYFFETMYIGDKGLAQVSRVAPLGFKASYDPLDSSSPEGRVKSEGENPGYESSSEESVGEENNRDKRDTDESIEEEEKGVEDPLGFKASLFS